MTKRKEEKCNEKNFKMKNKKTQQFQKDIVYIAIKETRVSE